MLDLLGHSDEARIGEIAASYATSRSEADADSEDRGDAEEVDRDGRHAELSR